MASEPTRSGNPIVEYFKGFAVLKETRTEYWGLQAVNFLDMTAYFALYGIVVVFLSEDFGFSDVEAGYVYAAFTLFTTMCLWVSGFVTDWLGIRKTVYVSMIALLITRIAVTWAALTEDGVFAGFGAAIHYKDIVSLLGLSPDVSFRGYFAALFIVLMAPAMAMVQTMLQAGIRRFTTRRSRGPGFNLWYLFMNVGAACAGFMIDIVRKALQLENAYIIGFGIFTAVACVAVAAIFIRREEQLYGPDETPEPEAVETGRRRNPAQIAWAVATRAVFWRFMVLVVLLLGVRAVFLYLHLLCPKFWLRVIGPEAAIGTLQAINPILVIIGLILFIPILGRFTVYGMLTYGAIVSSLSLFFLAIPTYGLATYWATMGFLIVLTIGEIIWSPRLQEYTAAIAPKGQEGTYLGLSLFPWFFAKFAVSTMSGHLLNWYVPEAAEGEPILRDRLARGEIPFWESPAAMWLILGFITLAGPLIALLLRGWFTKGARWETADARTPKDAPKEAAVETPPAEVEPQPGSGSR